MKAWSATLPVFTIGATHASTRPGSVHLHRSGGWRADEAGAGVITFVSAVNLPGSSTGSIGPFGVIASPDNDNAVGESPNSIQSTIFMNTFGIIDIEFLVDSSGGTTEFFFPETLINNSGLTWTDYHFELGFGLGVEFVSSGAGDFLDFDMPDADLPTVSSGFPSWFNCRTHWSSAAAPSRRSALCSSGSPSMCRTGSRRSTPPV